MLDHREHIVQVGQRNRPHAALAQFLHHRLQAQRTVQQRILAVQVQVYEAVAQDNSSLTGPKLLR